MLVLTRKRMEKLYIGGDICVTVVRLEGGQVRLGIDAPRHVPVIRAELRQRDAAAAALEASGGEPATVGRGEPWPSPRGPLANRPRGSSGPAQGCATRSGSRKR